MSVACFDLDGTVLDPNGSIRAAIDHAVAHGGFEPFPPGDVLIGMPLRDILRLRTDDPTTIEAMVTAFRDEYIDHAWRLVKPYPGVIEVIAEVHDAGTPTAIVTTKGEDEARHLLDSLGLRKHFDTIVGDDDIRPLKPDPAPVVAACGRLGFRSQGACMVGDTVYDIAAGKAAGCWTIGVSWGHGGDGRHGIHSADETVHDADGLRQALAYWNAGRHNP